MSDIMDWEHCKREFIKEVSPDPHKIKSMLEIAKERLQYTKEKSMTEKNVSFIIEGYYEVIKELLTAILLKNGLRSKNHQCLISFFYKKYPQYEAEAYLISNLSFLRNRLNYYGESIDIGFYNKNKDSIIQLINLLQKIAID